MSDLYVLLLTKQLGIVSVAELDKKIEHVDGQLVHILYHENNKVLVKSIFPISDGDDLVYNDKPYRVSASWNYSTSDEIQRFFSGAITSNMMKGHPEPGDYWYILWAIRAEIQIMEHEHKKYLENHGMICEFNHKKDLGSLHEIEQVLENLETHIKGLMKCL